MKKQLSLVLISLGLLACEETDVTKGTPRCVKESIAKFAESYACDKGGSVKEYLFQGRLVYVFDPGTCGADMASSVIDADCNTLGQLGGFIGNTRINGENFSTAEFKRTIWED